MYYTLFRFLSLKCLFRQSPASSVCKRKSSMLDRVKLFRSTIIAGLMISGCSAMLPSSREVSISPWRNYSAVKVAYDHVIPHKTTIQQLNDNGFNFFSTPNVRILNYLDIAAATQSIKWDYLDIDLQRCLEAKIKCQGYEFEPRDIRYKNYGNAFLDIFNFRRKIKQSGWSFKALFLVMDDTVIYKLWSGVPNIEINKDFKNPLGPLQDPGGLVFKAIP
jgi:hypothetical protein